MLHLLSLLALTPGVAVPQGDATAVLIDNFEVGVGRWKTNDGLAPEKGEPTIAAVFAVAPGAPEGGAQAALVEFATARGTWASVSRPVNGEVWAEKGCTGLSMWLKGDGSRSRVDIVLRSYTDEGGQTADTSFIRSVALATADWYAVRIPLSSFIDGGGRELGANRLRGVKLLQFVKSGTWDSMRFTVDEIRAEVFPTTARPEPGAGVTLVDFDRGGHESLLQHGLCLGDEADRLLHDERFAGRATASLALLGRSTVRVRASDFYRRDTQGVRTSDLEDVLAWIRSVGCEPLLCFDQPLSREGLNREEGWREFGALCAEIASRRRGEAGAHYYEVGSEPILAGQFRTVERATEAYNAIAAQIRQADPMAEVGGMGFASPWDEHLEYFIQHARNLRFVSFHFYGAHNPVATDDDLFKVACTGKALDLPHQSAPEGVRDMVRRRAGEVEVWITECALNSARDANGTARDGRIQGSFGAAWLMAFSMATAPYVDRILWFKAAGHGWGLLDDGGEPNPAFRAAALFSRFCPPGATLGKMTLSGPNVVLAAVSTEANRHVLVANAGQTAAVDLQLSGTPEVRPMRLRRIDPTSPEPAFAPTSPSSRQRLSLTGPGVAVLEAPNEG